MTKFSIKIISAGEAYSIQPNNDESISVSTNLGVFSRETICDYNILIVRLENVYGYHAKELDKNELDDFFNKPSVIVCISHEEILYKGYNRVWERDEVGRTVGNYDWLPSIQGLEIANKRGKSIQPTGESDRFTNLFDTYNWEYKCSFTKIPTKYIPIAVNISGQSVGLRAGIREGRIVIIPAPDVNIHSFDQYPTFLRLLIDICREEVQELVERERKAPDWVQSQIDPLESKLYDDIIPIYERYQALRETRKLLYETGARLTRIVYFVISKIGFKTEMKEEEGRQDIEVNEDDFSLVIEVTSSEEDWINIRKTRQLLDWCQRFKREQNKKPKGILIANPYCNLPPIERDEPFTKEALKQGESEGFCLMTTVQLYSIFCKFLKGELDKDKIKKLFLETEGMLKLEG